MGKVVKKLYQMCDFCKKEYERTGIDRNGQAATLNTIDLPGYYRGKVEKDSQAAYPFGNIRLRWRNH